VLRIRIRKYPKLLPSRIRIRNKLISRIRIRIQNYHWGSGLLKDKCSDKNTIFNIKSLISAQKWPLIVHSDLKCENFTNFTDKDLDPDPKRLVGRIRIQNGPQGRIRSSGSATLLNSEQIYHAQYLKNKKIKKDFINFCVHINQNFQLFFTISRF